MFKSFAQVDKLDSLNEIVNNTSKTKSTRIEALFELAEIYQPQDLNKSLESINAALVLLNESSNEQLIGEAFNKKSKNLHLLNLKKQFNL